MWYVINDMKMKIIQHLVVVALLVVAQWCGVAAVAQPAAVFTQDTISDALLARMRKGGSWKVETPVALRAELRYLRIQHWDADGQPQVGEMVVNQRIADRVLRIFRKLYEAGYRVERMRLVDDYGADDEAAMQDNNTSCFNFRFIAHTKKISKHGSGLAIDLNPLYNPCVKATGNGANDIQPAAGRPYAFNRQRRKDIPYKIDRKDLAYKFFIADGFTWGGAWRSLKDYQHFEFPQ